MSKTMEIDLDKISDEVEQIAAQNQAKVATTSSKASKKYVGLADELNLIHIRMGQPINSQKLVELLEQAVQKSYEAGKLTSLDLYFACLATKKIIFSTVAEIKKSVEDILNSDQAKQYANTRPQAQLKLYASYVEKLFLALDPYVQGDKKKVMSWGNFVRLTPVQSMMAQIVIHIKRKMVTPGDKKMIHSKALWMSMKNVDALYIWTLHAQYGMALFLKVKNELKFVDTDYLPFNEKSNRDKLAALLEGFTLPEIQPAIPSKLKKGCTDLDTFFLNVKEIVLLWTTDDLCSLLGTISPIAPILLKQTAEFRQSKRGTETHENWKTIFATIMKFFTKVVTPTIYQKHQETMFSFEKDSADLENHWTAFQIYAFVIRVLTRRLLPTTSGPDTRQGEKIVQTAEIPDF